MTTTFAMPSIDTEHIPSDVEHYVKRAYDAVKNEDSLPEEGYETVPVYIDNTRQYAGVTHIHKNGHASRVGISEYVGRDPVKIERVAKHEFRHAKAAKLVKYADVHEDVATLVMEGYAEYEGIRSALKKGNTKEANEIMKSTPYPYAVFIAQTADKVYKSEIDGKKGYRTFIRDIYKYKSMNAALQNLKKNVQEAAMLN